MDQDLKKRWPHKEMLIVGKTKEGHRIARKDNGQLRVLAPDQEAIEYFYNGPTLGELMRLRTDKK